MKHLRTYLVVVAALVTAIVAASAAQAGNPPPSVTRALEIRGQGLDQLCEGYTLVGKAYAAACGTAGARNRPTADELRALEIRGQAMNHLCDKSTSTALCGVAAHPAAPVVSSSGFSWDDFGIGAGTMLGLVLLAGGISAAVHYGRRTRMRPRTAS